MIPATGGTNWTISASTDCTMAKTTPSPRYNPIKANDSNRQDVQLSQNVAQVQDNTST